ncbi:MAG: DUF3276 family protein [Candidatus Hydrothermia bacterium]|jgi:hypothetical protein
MDLRKHQSNIVYSKRIKAGKRVYFFDIRQGSKGQNFICISESRKTDRGFIKQRIVIYPEDIEKFYKAFEEVKNSLK